MEASTTVRAALGRMAVIGDLYDMCSDRFIGASMFKKESRVTDLVMKTGTVGTEFLISDTFREKAETLNVQPELQLSLLAGLVEPSGSGRCLLNMKQSAKAVRCSCIFSIQTQIQQVDLFSEEVKNWVAWHTLYGTHQATHVVSEIHWGATSVVTLEHANSKNSESEDIKRDLQSAFSNVICGCGCTVHKSMKMGNKNLSVHTFSDVTLPNITAESCNGNADILDKMHECLAMSDEGKGLPQSYLLVPLHAVKEYLKVGNIHSQEPFLISEPSTENIKMLCEQFDKIKQEYYDLAEAMKLRQACFTEKNMKFIETTLKNIGTAKGQFMTKIAKRLPSIRRGRKVAKQLDIWERLFTCSGPKSLQYFFYLQTIASQLKSKMLLYDFFTNLGITFFGSDSSFESIQTNCIDELYILFYSEEEMQRNGKHWDDNIIFFLGLLQLAKKTFRDMKPEMTSFAVVDTDVHPELVAYLEEAGSIHVSLYRSGNCIDQDVFQSYTTICHSQPPQKLDDQPKKLGVWPSFCPNSFSSQYSVKDLTCCKDTCEDEKSFNWICEDYLHSTCNTMDWNVNMQNM